MLSVRVCDESVRVKMHTDQQACCGVVCRGAELNEERKEKRMEMKLCSHVKNKHACVTANTRDKEWREGWEEGGKGKELQEVAQ